MDYLGCFCWPLYLSLYYNVLTLGLRYGQDWLLVISFTGICDWVYVTPRSCDLVAWKVPEKKLWTLYHRWHILVLGVVISSCLFIMFYTRCRFMENVMLILQCLKCSCKMWTFRLSRTKGLEQWTSSQDWVLIADCIIIIISIIIVIFFSEVELSGLLFMNCMCIWFFFFMESTASFFKLW